MQTWSAYTQSEWLPPATQGFLYGFVSPEYYQAPPRALFNCGEGIPTDLNSPCDERGQPSLLLENDPYNGITQEITGSAPNSPVRNSKLCGCIPRRLKIR